jgi:hypothetical protein
MVASVVRQSELTARANAARELPLR